jgi:hypothetical protein
MLESIETARQWLTSYEVDEQQWRTVAVVPGRQVALRADSRYLELFSTCLGVYLLDESFFYAVDSCV